MSHLPRLTLRDIARQTGVSYQTVSRVINNHPYVSEDTRQRVQEAIAEMGYRPNKAARSLAGRRSFTLALVAVQMEYFGPLQTLVYIERAARGAGYDLIFTHAADMTRAHLAAALDSLLHWQVDGIVLLKPVEGIGYEEALALCHGVPLVQVGGETDPAIPSVRVDQAHGMRLATEHLIGLGHREIGFLAGPPAWFDAAERQASWAAALAAAGLSAQRLAHGDWSAESGYAAARRLLAEAGELTALVTANDQMALGALTALREAGRRVPEDVSLVGYDDLPESRWFAPPLTTIRQDFETLGRLGVAYLLERLNDPDTPHEQRLIPPQLVVRASTAPA